MNETEVTVVRVYLGEREGHLEDVLALLRERGVSGWTVYRGVSGYGQSGKVRAASLADLSLDLPVTVEFFDARAAVDGLLADLTARAGDGHVIHWPATLAHKQA